MQRWCIVIDSLRLGKGRRCRTETVQWVHELGVGEVGMVRKFC